MVIKSQREKHIALFWNQKINEKLLQYGSFFSCVETSSMLFIEILEESSNERKEMVSVNDIKKHDFHSPCIVNFHSDAKYM